MKICVDADACPAAWIAGVNHTPKATAERSFSCIVTVIVRLLQTHSRHAARQRARPAHHRYAFPLCGILHRARLHVSGDRQRHGWLSLTRVLRSIWYAFPMADTVSVVVSAALLYRIRMFKVKPLQANQADAARPGPYRPTIAQPDNSAALTPGGGTCKTDGVIDKPAAPHSTRAGSGLTAKRCEPDTN